MLLCFPCEGWALGRTTSGQENFELICLLPSIADVLLRRCFFEKPWGNKLVHTAQKRMFILPGFLRSLVEQCSSIGATISRDAPCSTILPPQRIPTVLLAKVGSLRCKRALCVSVVGRARRHPTKHSVKGVGQLVSRNRRWRFRLVQ